MNKNNNNLRKMIFKIFNNNNRFPRKILIKKYLIFIKILQRKIAEVKITIIKLNLLLEILTLLNKLFLNANKNLINLIHNMMTLLKRLK